MSNSPKGLPRRAAVARLLENRGDLLVVTGLGSATYDVHAAGDHDANFYLWGAMGGAAMVGLGLAQARPDSRVLVITGDGEQLMGLGGLATIAVAKPRNLTIVVLDNGQFGETGQQDSHTGLGIDLARIAAAAGFVEARTVTDMAGVDAVREAIHTSAGGPRLYAFAIEPGNVPRSLPLRDAVAIKTRFRATLGLGPN